MKNDATPPSYAQLLETNNLMQSVGDESYWLCFTRTVQEETSFVPETEEDDLSLKKVKSFYFKPMTREEAVMQMNLLEHNFFAFRDEDNGGSFAVVYRRNDGGYGLIDDAE